MRMTLGPEAGKTTDQRGKRLMTLLRDEGLVAASTWEKRSKRATWKEKELDYIICGSDMAPFIWEESNEQETEGLDAQSDHTAVMARFDMAGWGLKLKELKEAAKNSEEEITRIPANWKPRDVSEFNQKLREELVKERANITRIELLINETARTYASRQRRDVCETERKIKELVQQTNAE